jgi:hypothetical protein
MKAPISPQPIDQLEQVFADMTATLICPLPAWFEDL